MSGGGGTLGQRGGGRRRGNDVSKCETLSMEATLLSPAPLILATLKPMEVLSMEYTSPKGPVRVVTTGGDVAGTIAGKDMLELINCLEEGFTYRVIVKSIIGGNCTVIIKP